MKRIASLVAAAAATAVFAGFTHAAQLPQAAQPAQVNHYELSANGHCEFGLGGVRYGGAGGWVYRWDWACG